MMLKERREEYEMARIVHAGQHESDEDSHRDRDNVEAPKSRSHHFKIATIVLIGISVAVSAVLTFRILHKKQVSQIVEEHSLEEKNDTPMIGLGDANSNRPFHETFPSDVSFNPPTQSPIQVDDKRKIWTEIQSLVHEGYNNVYIDFSPDGTRLCVAYRRQFLTDGPGLVEVYEKFSDEKPSWFLIGSFNGTNPYFDLKMTTRSSIWIGNGVSSNFNIQHLLLSPTSQTPTNNMYDITVGSEVPGEDPNGFNFAVEEEEGGSEATVVMGYPMYTPDGTAEHPEWGLGFIKTVFVTLSPDNPGHNEVVSSPRLLYKGSYRDVWMGRSVAISNNRVAISGVSENTIYPDDGPPASAVMSQVVPAYTTYSDENSRVVVGDFTFYTSDPPFQFTRVALHENVWAILASFGPMQVHIFNYNEANNSWSALGTNPVTNISEPLLDGNNVHIKYWANPGGSSTESALHNGDRFAIGGVGFEAPGYIAVFEYDGETGQWGQLGTTISQLPNESEIFAQGMAFSDQWIVHSKKDSMFGNGKITLSLKRLMTE